MKLLHSGAFAKGFVHDELPFAGSRADLRHQLVEWKLIEVLRKAQTVSAVFQRTDGFLKGLFVILADAHDLADCPHLCAQLVFNTFEFLKGPAGEFNHDILTRRRVFFECSIPPVWNLIESKTTGQHR